MSLFNVCLLSCGLLNGVAAWGPDGHTIVAHIAEHYLSPDVDAALRADLLNDTLSHASAWNDNFDHTPDGKWSAPLHFIDYTGRACKFDWDTNCQNDFCVAGSIVNYTKQIFDPSLSKSDRFFALKFLIHMVGDIHQPLHVSSRDDHGGNSIKVQAQFSANQEQLSQHPTNLHSVWDGKIVIQDIHDIEDGVKLRANKKPYVVHYQKWELLATSLEQRLDAEWAAQKSAWQATVAHCRDESSLRAGLSSVAQETVVRGCEYAYNYADGSAVKTGDVLDREYYLRAQPIVEEQLAKGGVRLAQLLEEALAQSRMRFSQIIV